MVSYRGTAGLLCHDAGLCGVGQSAANAAAPSRFLADHWAVRPFPPTTSPARATGTLVDKHGSGPCRGRLGDTDGLPLLHPMVHFWPLSYTLWHRTMLDDYSTDAVSNQAAELLESGIGTRPGIIDETTASAEFRSIKRAISTGFVSKASG